jgi:hypothetical protein
MTITSFQKKCTILHLDMKFLSISRQALADDRASLARIRNQESMEFKEELVRYVRTQQSLYRAIKVRGRREPY